MRLFLLVPRPLKCFEWGVLFGERRGWLFCDSLSAEESRNLLLTFANYQHPLRH
jgi:hypothetical protein